MKRCTFVFQLMIGATHCGLLFLTELSDSNKQNHKVKYVKPNLVALYGKWLFSLWISEKRICLAELVVMYFYIYTRHFNNSVRITMEN